MEDDNPWTSFTLPNSIAELSSEQVTSRDVDTGGAQRHVEIEPPRAVGCRECPWFTAQLRQTGLLVSSWPLWRIEFQSSHSGRTTAVSRRPPR